VKSFAAKSQKRFSGDRRFDLRGITEGFAIRTSDSADDRQLLERICEAYARAIQDQKSAPAHYAASGWWTQVQSDSLDAVIQALKRGNTTMLGRMYSNFFRDPCAAGLVQIPFGMRNAYFNQEIGDSYGYAYLGAVLARLDYWSTHMGESVPLSRLAGPNIGNPFGAMIDGTLVRPGAEYQHYCAAREQSFLHAGDRSCVVEIGGGYGGMAYYLLRDQPGIAYIDFDTPESIALTSYYLLKAFPSLKSVLYGEQDVAEVVTSGGAIALMPLFEMSKLRASVADVTFSSNAISDLSQDVLKEYLRVIERSTSGVFIYVGKRSTADLISEIASSWTVVETRESRWHDCHSAVADEVERVFKTSR
jgi:hypothetical protein